MEIFTESKIIIHSINETIRMSIKNTPLLTSVIAPPKATLYFDCEGGVLWSILSNIRIVSEDGYGY